jgi:hypothetical protein
MSVRPAVIGAVSIAAVLAAMPVAPAARGSAPAPGLILVDLQPSEAQALLRRLVDIVIRKGDDRPIMPALTRLLGVPQGATVYQAIYRDADLVRSCNVFRDASGVWQIFFLRHDASTSAIYLADADATLMRVVYGTIAQPPEFTVASDPGRDRHGFEAEMRYWANQIDVLAADPDRRSAPALGK